MILLIRPSFFKMLKLVSFLALLGVMVCPLWAGKKGGASFQEEQEAQEDHLGIRIPSAKTKKIKKSFSKSAPYIKLTQTYLFELTQKGGYADDFENYEGPRRKDGQPMKWNDYDTIIKKLKSIKDNKITKYAQKTRNNFLNRIEALKKKITFSSNSTSQSSSLPPITSTNDFSKTKKYLGETTTYVNLSEVYNVRSLSRKDGLPMSFKDYETIESNLAGIKQKLWDASNVVKDTILNEIRDQKERIKNSIEARLIDPSKQQLGTMRQIEFKKAFPDSGPLSFANIVAPPTLKRLSVVSLVFPSTYPPNPRESILPPLKDHLKEFFEADLN